LESDLRCLAVDASNLVAAGAPERRSDAVRERGGILAHVLRVLLGVLHEATIARLDEASLLVVDARNAVVIIKEDLIRLGRALVLRLVDHHLERDGILARNAELLEDVRFHATVELVTHAVLEIRVCFADSHERVGTTHAEHSAQLFGKRAELGIPREVEWLEELVRPTVLEPIQLAFTRFREPGKVHWQGIGNDKESQTAQYGLHFRCNTAESPTKVCELL